MRSSWKSTAFRFQQAENNANKVLNLMSKTELKQVKLVLNQKVNITCVILKCSSSINSVPDLGLKD